MRFQFIFNFIMGVVFGMSLSAMAVKYENSQPKITYSHK